jgi:hypothetical protein
MIGGRNGGRTNRPAIPAWKVILHARLSHRD